MQGFELLGVSIIFFVAYLFLPAWLYRFGAETHIDLRRPTDVNELEGFLVAAVPSAAMHLATFGLMKFVAICPILKHYSLPVAVDWNLVASFITAHERQAAYRTLAAGPTATLVYFFSVLVVSFFLGRMFGSHVLGRVKNRAVDEIPEPPFGLPAATPLQRVVKTWHWSWWSGRVLWFLAFEALYAVNWKIGNAVLHENVDWTFRWSILKPTVFVRTKGSRLYFGQFERYSKDNNGETATITLTDVWRYCFDEVDRTIAAGRVPFADFKGTLTLTWGEVADIHEALPEHLAGLRNRYEGERIRFLAKTLLESFDGETLTVDQMCRRRLGGDEFTREDIRAAVSHLVDVGVLRDPLAEAAAVVDLAKAYAFPKRSQPAPHAEQLSTQGVVFTNESRTPSAWPDRDVMGRPIRRRRRDRIILRERRKYERHPIADGGGDDDGNGDGSYVTRSVIDDPNSGRT